MAKMTGEQLDVFLAQPLIARLGVVTDAGDPYVVPIWYEWDNDRLLFAVREKANYVPALRSGRRACMSIAEDHGDLRRALITGRVEVVREAAPDTGEWLERSRAMCRRYLGDAGGDDYQDETLSRPCIWFALHARRHRHLG